MNLTAQDEIAVYVEGVREALAGLPAATRDELLEDLPEHLAEVLAEGGGSLYERLGPPAAYAAELSASAGFTTATPPAGERSRIAETAARHRARIDRVLRRVDERTGPVLGYARASEFLALLRPAWWVLRGYLAAMAVAFMLHDHDTPLGLLPRAGDDDLAAILLLSLGILGSIWLGRRAQPAGSWPWRLQRLGTGFLVIFAVVGFFEVDSAAQRDYYYTVDYTDPRPEPLSDVRDVFVYDAEGRLLVGVQLYDQNGQPIRLGEPTCYDEHGSPVPIVNPGYPYCPGQAPFQAGEPSLSTAPSTGPSAGAAEQPSGTPTTPAIPSPSR
ncbi:HAAS signaling domain-containing protein [Actinoplanes xinjiangensis]|uniref:HAAS signaling domain-containing protein n=1 Tax=Actinoplanes xinjiangensis TaxID=512350 RepID=UPI00341A9C06